MNNQYNQQMNNQFNNQQFNPIKQQVVSRKSLYIMVAIAALFIAGISGTFAYFAASASNSTAISGNIGNVAVTLDVTEVSSKTATNGNKIIPFNLCTGGSDNTTATDGTGTCSASATLAKTSITSAVTAGCVDTRGYKGCEIYQISVKSGSSTVPGTVKVNITSESKNLKWYYLGNSTSAVTGSSIPVPTATTAANVRLINGTATNYTISSSDITSSNTYHYILVWLEDTGNNQTSLDAGKAFSGTVTVQGTGDTAGQVTAKF